MIAGLLTIFLAVTSSQVTNVISDAQKKEFIGLVKGLPTKGEFFTPQAIDKASPYLPVLFALTEKDIEKYDIYPFLALSRGLCDRKIHRTYAVRHFADIRHPILKLFWGAILFDARATSPEIVRFLRTALESEKQAQMLAEMSGPNFADFQRRVKAYPSARSHGKSFQSNAPQHNVSCEEAAKHAPQIKAGMREQEVLDLLGEPKARSGQEWDYYWGECLPPPQVGQQIVTGLAIIFENEIIKDIKYAWIDATGTAPGAAPAQKRKKKRAAKSKKRATAAANYSFSYSDS